MIELSCLTEMVTVNTRSIDLHVNDHFGLCENGFVDLENQVALCIGRVLLSTIASATVA